MNLELAGLRSYICMLVESCKRQDCVLRYKHLERSLFIFPIKLFILLTLFYWLPLVSNNFDMKLSCCRFGQLQTVDLQSIEPSIRAGAWNHS